MSRPKGILLRRWAAACGLAVALAAPPSPAFAHVAVHAIEDAHHHEHDGKTHGHKHDGDAEHHEVLRADTTPAVLGSSPIVDFLRQGQESPACEFASAMVDPALAGLRTTFDTGPPLTPPSLLLRSKPADRAPPA
ncbi:MAG: hypothetical protein HY554_01045 [Elusimicrobia bacterium]|nr:hypothetical protein [Elusimicrobiota bacterium]